MSSQVSFSPSLDFFACLAELQRLRVPDDVIAHRLHIGTRALTAIRYGGARPSPETLAAMPRVYSHFVAVRRGK